MRLKPVRALVGLAASAAVALLSATPSLALIPDPPTGPVAGNGICESGEFCLYYNSNQSGSMVDLGDDRTDYGTGTNCVKFLSVGSGKGLCVKNNAASADNRKSIIVTVFAKNDWAGAIDAIPAGNKTNLTVTKNDNAGHLAGDAANDNLSVALYQASGGHISCYFDGYITTDGRHEGIDISRNIGDAVFALTAGTVTRKSEGFTGSGGLSTLAIYNANLNKTVIYLHTDPLNSLNVGDYVAKGDKIAFESWRGVSSSGSAHTHVEMRKGEQTSAAPSVDDYDLTNPNPTSFWMNRGYNIGRS